MTQQSEQTTAESQGERLMSGPSMQEAHSGSGLTLTDIYFVLFRNKWTIVLSTILGIVGAIFLYMRRPPRYQSEAEIMIRYVLEQRPMTSVGPNAQITAPEAQPQYLLNSELEILTSFDLIEQVVDTIGAARILASLGGGDSRTRAAFVIRDNLKAELPRNSNIIRLAFRHPDPDIVQPVLSHVISNYFGRHVEMHGGAGFVDEALSRQAERLRRQLDDTEASLRKVKSDAGIISLEDTKRASSLRLSQLRTSLDETEANLAERRAMLQRLQSPNADTNALTEPSSNVPADKAAEHRNVIAQLESARLDEVHQLGQYAEGSRFVQAARERVSVLEKRKQDLEREFPQLTTSNARTTGTEVRANPATEVMQIAALQAKLEVFRAQFDALSREATNYEQIETAVLRLERERDLLRTNYYSLNASIQQARFAEALSPGRVSNFSVVQTPSPPVKDYSKTTKSVAVALGGGIAFGILLAFLTELVLDRRFKRPSDVTKELRLPLFASVPLLTLNDGVRFHASKMRDGRGRTESAPLHPIEPASPTQASRDFDNAGFVHKSSASPQPTAVGNRADFPDDTEFVDAGRGNRKTQTALGALFKRKSLGSIAEPQPEVPTSCVNAEALVPAQRGANASVVWHGDSGMEPYSEALRSRIVGHFEAINLTRKPKLVGVASCNKGSGVSSIAGSLAASMSQIGDGKVLLVDLNLEKGMAHPFYDGKPVVGVSEALDHPKHMQEIEDSNLVVATANDFPGSPLSNLPSALPRRFAGLVPKLKASDYDYIIFDLPPVDQTSITARVASYMDLTLLVLESERTRLDAAKQVTKLLSDLKANVACVLNKTRKYVPAWLQEEL